MAVIEVTNRFFLDEDDERLFIYWPDGSVDRLQPDFIEWLELFVGKMLQSDNLTIDGHGWRYEECIDEDTGQFIHIMLTIDDPKHAAMFKLMWGYDVAGK